MDTYFESWDSSSLLANDHAEQDTGCLDCHPFNIGQSTKEVIAFITGNYENPLEKREFSQDMCFQCHEEKTWDELKQLTEYMVITIGMNPHDIPQDEAHESIETNECYLCHNVHQSSVDFCSQCHGALVTDDGWTTLPPYATAPWSPDADCSECHSKYVTSMTDVALLSYAHVEAGEDNCINCHSDVDSMAKKHENILIGKPIKQQTYPQEFCLVCHGTYAGLVKLTASSTVLKDLNGTVVNPHDIPQTPEHINNQINECYKCHKVHQPYDAYDYCVGCHHEQVFECGTCHE
jgi:hypothetical protein